MTGILVLGAGGHGKVVADILCRAGTPAMGFLDDDPETWGTTRLGLPARPDRLGRDDRPSTGIRGRRPWTRTGSAARQVRWRREPLDLGRDERIGVGASLRDPLPDGFGVGEDQELLPFDGVTDQPAGDDG